MTMLQSSHNNLFSAIFDDNSASVTLRDRSNYPSLIIKLLLVLEIENLIPLFELENDHHRGISATVINGQNKIVSVQNIIAKFGSQINPFTLFFGSHFQLELKEVLLNNISHTLVFNSFIILTKEGLIFEYPELDNYTYNGNLSRYWQSGKTSLIFWEDWHDISLEFSQDIPECSLIFSNKQGSYLKISYHNENVSEDKQIEQQLPLIFCYFMMKNFWKYIDKIHNNSFSIFHPEDFLYLDCDRLNYFIDNVLSQINITEKDLENLVKKINHK